MRRALPLLLVALAACPEPVEDPVGSITSLQVEVVSDTCTPARLGGDGGQQFFALQADGGAQFSVGQQLLYGPLRDGGSLEGVQRQVLNAGVAVPLALGEAAACNVGRMKWTIVDGGLELDMTWPGSDACPAGPVWLPELECRTLRRFVFTPGAECRASCVTVSSAAEVTCECPAP